MRTPVTKLGMREDIDVAGIVCLHTVDDALVVNKCVILS